MNRLTANVLRSVILLLCWLAGNGALLTAADESGKPADSNPEAATTKDQPIPKEIAEAFANVENNEQLLVARRALRLTRLPHAPVPPTVTGPIFNPIDAFITASWESNHLAEAKQAPEICDDSTFIRRVYLDLIGAIPKTQDAQRFVSDPFSHKRTRLVDDLLARNSDYAAHWTPFWEEALGSANVNTQGGILTRGNYRIWILNNFARNRPYDVMVAELIDPTMPGHLRFQEQEVFGQKFPISFIRNSTHTATIQTASDIGQVFLGTAMKCASCHSHFENKEWPQARFLAFAGMFAPQDLELIRCEKRSGEIIPARFPFEIPDTALDAPADINARLHRVAQLLVDPANPRFAKTIVNRLWKRYFGLGLFEPVDDFRADRSAANPALLEWLADDFMRHNYDLKHTIRLILTSRTYQLKYDPTLEDKYDSANPALPRYYRSPALRRLTAEQLLDSVAVAVRQEWSPGKRLYLRSTSSALTRALGRPSVRNEISTARSDESAIVQALELLNGDEYHELIYSGRVLDVFAEEKDFRVTVEQVYRAVLGRAPNAPELTLGVKFLETNRISTPTTSGPPVETVLIDDQLPFLSEPDGSLGTNSWKWVSAPDYPVFSGQRAHTFAGTNEVHQHALNLDRRPLSINPQDVFFTHIYLDPKNLPKRIMIQWHEGNIYYQGLWTDEPNPQLYPSEGRIPFFLGKLPPPGVWTRLQVPFQSVKLEGGRITGISFDELGGTVYWDKTGITRTPRNPMTIPLGDMVWALITSPEFQYIK